MVGKKSKLINAPENFVRVTSAIAKLRGMPRERYLEELTKELEKEIKMPLKKKNENWFDFKV